MEKLLLTRRIKSRMTFILLLTLLWGQSIFAQGDFTVTGQITEQDGSTPLPGVAIMEKGTANGTITDLNGQYSITVADEKATLIVSFLGYETQEVDIGSRSNIDLLMVAKDEALDEVVVIGYGELKKRDVTGSVGSLDTESLVEKGVNNPMEAIQGNVAGVQISSSSGRLGDEFDITIRGKNSMSEDAKPLYVVDGTPTDGIDFLNPQDIERIDVLKDASSTAIYGSRGSNGVIIVTTKSGASAKSGVVVSLDSYYGIKKAARLPNMMDGPTWEKYHYSAYLATIGGDPMDITADQLEGTVIGGSNAELARRFAANETFDWYDAVLKDGFTANNYISVQGMSENGTAYNLGIGMQNETGLIDKESLDKYTFKASVFHNISDKVKIGTNLTIAATDQEQGSDIAMQEAFRLAPFLNPWAVDENNNILVGELYPNPGKLEDVNGDYLINKTSTYNPLLQIANSSDNTKRWNLLGSAFAEYKPLEWLTFKSTFSAGYDARRRGQSWGALTNEGASNRNLPLAELEKRSRFNYTWDNQFNINYTLNDDHNFNFMGLQSIYSSKTESSEISSRYMPFETGFHNIGSGDQGTFNLGSNYVEQSLASFALRLNYSFKGRYLLTLSNRWDGSSLLSEGNKWESFPSGALAWRISEERFLQDQDIVSNLKLRVSYGFTGNNIISPYSTLNKLDLQTYYDFNGTVAQGWLPSALSNSTLTWEKTKELNFGVDFGFLNHRISGSVDIYDRLSDELLMVQQLPRESGWAEINANVGSVSNKGVEVALTTVNVNTNLVKWETTFIFSKNKNEIKSLYGQTEADDVGNKWFIGESIDSEYDYEFNGIWQANEADLAASYDQTEGQTKVVDQNNDGVIDPEDDRIILGSRDPKWSGSFLTKLTIANFDLSATVITNQGVFVYSDFHRNFADTRDRGRQKLDINWYIPANGAGIEPQYSNEYPQPRNMGPYGRHRSDTQRGMQNYKEADFVKIKNISLGYTFNEKILSKIKLSYLRVYFNVIDPFVFTDYEGFDPEWATADFAIARVGSVTYQFGLNLKF